MGFAPASGHSGRCARIESAERGGDFGDVFRLQWSLHCPHSSEPKPKWKNKPTIRSPSGSLHASQMKFVSNF